VDTLLIISTRGNSQLSVARCRIADTRADGLAIGDLLSPSELSSHFTLWHWIWNATRFQ
jgi:hypothetical protein